jgi:hypothetical protein
MKVKISEAKGQVLDYLVAQAMGMKIYRSKSGRWMRANYGEFNHRHGTPWFEPTRSWGYAGPIIEREWLDVTPWPNESVGTKICVGSASNTTATLTIV